MTYQQLGAEGDSNDILDGMDDPQEKKEVVIQNRVLAKEINSPESAQPDEEDAMAGILNKLRVLEKLKNEGLLEEDDYEHRRMQLIDRLTCTSSSKKQRGYSTVSTVDSWIGPIGGTTEKGLKNLGPQTPPTDQPTIIPHPPPESWDHIPRERALRYTWDQNTRKWKKKNN